MEEQKKIYIGNIAYSVNEWELKQTLSEQGVECSEIIIITDKYSGRSKGFGFAEFNSEDDTQKAIDILNGKELDGMTLQVNKARKNKPYQSNYKGNSFNTKRRY